MFYVIPRGTICLDETSHIPKVFGLSQSYANWFTYPLPHPSYLSASHDRIPCSVVQQLGLPGCGINPSGARYISEVLCNKHITCNIQKLNLSDNENVSD